jgi:CRISPR-associated protein Csb1
MTISPDDLVNRIEKAVALESSDAGIRIGATLRPAAGNGAKVFPPTYKVDGSETPYLFEERFASSGAAANTVLLDALQSQANRVEEALSDAIEEGRLQLPTLRLAGVVEGVSIEITNLSAPHRGPDAYFRDAQLADGTMFDKTEVGVALRTADTKNATPYFQYVPSDLLYGFWDSQRGGRGTKLPRCYTSEIFGWNPYEGKRAAGRVDPNNIEKVAIAHPKKKPGEFIVPLPDEKPPKDFDSHKPSDVGHGNIPPSFDGKAGVSISGAERLGFLSFAGLHKLRFPNADGTVTFERNVAARTVLACLGLVGDRLAFRRPTLLLRSGCELVVVTEELSWLGAGGSTDPFELDTTTALGALQIALSRAEKHGLKWDSKPFELEPQKRLRDLLAATFTRYTDD